MGTPANPAADEGLLYFKSDGKLYKKIGSIEQAIDGNPRIFSATVVANSNIAISTPGSQIDLQTLVSGDRLLLVAQTTASQNGLYVWTGATTPLTRAPEWNDNTEANLGDIFTIIGGYVYTGASYIFNGPSPFSIGSSALTFRGTSSDSVTLNRAFHIGTQTASTISDFNVAAQTAVGPVTGTALGAGNLFVTMSATAPGGTLLCDGSVVSRATYPALFTAISTLFNTGGEAGTDFRLPNLKGRIPVGLDSSQTEFDVLGETGGSKTVSLTSDQNGPHIHNFNGQTFTWGQSGLASSVYASGAVATAGNPPGNTLVTAQGQAGYNSALSSGLGSPHNNLQPYIVGNWVITTGGAIGAIPATTEYVEKTATTATLSIATTTTAVPELSHTLSSSGPGALYEVRADLDWGPTGNATQTVELVVDGTLNPKNMYIGQGPMRIPGSKAWTLTGLSAGSHTINFQSRVSSGTGAIYGANSTTSIRRLK